MFNIETLNYSNDPKPSRRRRCIFEKKGMQSCAYLRLVRLQLLRLLDHPDKPDHPLKKRCDTHGRLISTQPRLQLVIPRKVIPPPGQRLILSPKSRKRSTTTPSPPPFPEHLRSITNIEGLTRIEDDESARATNEAFEHGDVRYTKDLSAAKYDEELEPGEIREDATSHVERVTDRSTTTSKTPAYIDVMSVHNSIEEDTTFEVAAFDSSSSNEDSSEDELSYGRAAAEIREWVTSSTQATPQRNRMSAQPERPASPQNGSNRVDAVEEHDDLDI